MIGRFIASGPGAPCHRCGNNIRAGADIYYDGPRLDDSVRTCADCATSRLKIGSLFTGYGGLDIAAETAFNAQTAWVSDTDRGACKVLTHRYPGVPNLGDITAIDWDAVEPVDIITGGSPCQDLSHAGRRGGMTEGTRSNLWVAMRESIAAIRPTYVVWENVRGAYSAGADSDLEPCPGCVGDGPATHLRALGRVLGDLSDLGYDTQWRGLRAADVGAPHGRFRVFVVASLADADRARLGSLGRVDRVGRDAHRRSGEDADGNSAESAPPAHAAGNGWHEGRTESAGVLGRPDAAERSRQDGRLTLLPSPRTSDTNGSGQHGDGGMDLRTAVTLLPTPTTEPTTGNGHARNLGAEARLFPTPMVGSTSPAAHGQISGQFRDQMDAALDRFGDYAPAIARWGAVTGLPAPAPTEPTGRGGARRLSPRFTEWMMGLPAGWITDVPGITRNEALKACGNGVVPQQAYAAICDALAAEAVAA